MPNSSYDKDKGLGATEATETGTGHMKINHNFDIKKKLVLNGQRACAASCAPGGGRCPG